MSLSESLRSALSSAKVGATKLSRATTYAAALFGIWQGVAILASSPVRFSAPAFVLIRTEPVAWGMSALMLGLCVAFGYWFRWFVVKAVGLLGLSAWSIVFAATAAKALAVPTAAPTAPGTYLFVAVNLAILVWADPTKGDARADSATTH